MSLRRINKFLITGVVSLFSFLASCKSEQPISPTQGGSSEKRAYTTKNVPAPLFKENNQYLQLNGKDSHLSFDKYFEYDRIVIIYKSRQKEIYPILSDGDTFSLYSIDSLDKICPTKPSLLTGHDFSDKSFDFLSFNGESLLGIKKANYGVSTYTDIMFPEEGKRLTTFVSADYGMFVSTPNHQWNHVFSRETTLEKPFVRSKNPLKIGIGKPFCGSPSVNGNSFFDGEIESIVFYYKYQKVREYHFLKENVVNGKLTDRITNQQDLTLHGTFEYTNFPTQDTAKLTDPKYYFDTKLQNTEALGDTVVTLFSNNGNNLYAKIRNSKTKQVLKDEFLVTSNAKNGKMKFFNGNILFTYQDTSTNNIYFKEFSSTGNLVKEATKVNNTQLPANVLFDINVDPSQNYFGFAYDNLDNSNWSNKFVYYTPSSVFARIFDRTGKTYNEFQMSTHFDYRNERFYNPTIALYENQPRATVFCNSQSSNTNTSFNPLVSFDLDFNANTISKYTGGFGVSYQSKVFTQTDNCFKVFYGTDFIAEKSENCLGDNSPKKLNEGVYSNERGFSVNAIRLFNSNTRSFYNDYLFGYVSRKDNKSKYQTIKRDGGIYPEITGREHVISTSVAYVSDGFIASEQVGELLSTWKYNTTTGTWTLIDVVKLADALKMKTTQIITGPSIEISGNNFLQYSGISYFVSGTQGGKALITVVTPSGKTLTKQVSLGINGNYSGILPTSFTSEVGNYTIWSTGENPTTERGNVTQFTISNLYATTNTINNKPFLRGEVHTVTNPTVGTAELEPKTQTKNDSALVWSEPKNATIPTLAKAELNSLKSSAPVLASNACIFSPTKRDFPICGNMLNIYRNFSPDKSQIFDKNPLGLPNIKKYSSGDVDIQGFKNGLVNNYIFTLSPKVEGQRIAVFASSISKGSIINFIIKAEDSIAYGLDIKLLNKNADISAKSIFINNENNEVLPITFKNSILSINSMIKKDGFIILSLALNNDSVFTVDIGSVGNSVLPLGFLGGNNVLLPNVIEFSTGYITGKYLDKVVLGATAYFVGKIASNSLFGSLKYASKYGISSVENLQDIVKTEKHLNNFGNDKINVHHLIEERFAGKWEQKGNEMLSIVVTESEHYDLFTRAWRNEIGLDGWKTTRLTTSTATKNDIANAARNVYKDYPEILKALGL